MKSCAMLSRFFVVVVVIFAGSLKAEDVLDVMQSAAAGTVKLYQTFERGEWVLKALREGNETVQDGTAAVVTSMVTSGAICYFLGGTSKEAFVGAIATGGTILLGGRALNKAKGTSVAHKAHNILGGTVTSRPVQLGTLCAAGFVAGYKGYTLFEPYAKYISKH
jgi:hypothetical protein